MKKNMGNADRIIRVLVAISLVILFAMNVITGTLAVILMIVAGIFVLTSLAGFCPVYALLHIDTCPRKIKQ